MTIVLRDERLEAIRDNIRRGVPVGITEAMEAIEYQERVKADRDARDAKNPFKRFLRWLGG